MNFNIEKHIKKFWSYYLMFFIYLALVLYITLFNVGSCSYYNVKNGNIVNTDSGENKKTKVVITKQIKNIEKDKKNKESIVNLNKDKEKNILIDIRNKEKKESERIVFKKRFIKKKKGLAINKKNNFIVSFLKNNINNIDYLVIDGIIYLLDLSKGDNFKVYDFNYVVKKGDHLSKISNKLNKMFIQFVNWKDIYKSNKEKIGLNPNLIYEGMELNISKIKKIKGESY